MLRLENKDYSQQTTLMFWFLMAFQAGYVNTGGFVTAMSFVSHVTGFGTSVGMYAAQKNYIMLLEMLSVPIFFIAGSFFSSWNIDRKKLQNKPTNQLLVIAVKSLAFGLVLFGGLAGIWGEFGDKIVSSSEFFLVPLLCFACGIQNATCAQLTGGFLKPTHLTGLSTDIGINFAKVIQLKKNKDILYREELKKNLIRVGVFVSFATGAASAYKIFTIFKYNAFIFPFAISLLFLAMGIFDKLENRSSSFLVKASERFIFALFVICVVYPLTQGVI